MAERAAARLDEIPDGGMRPVEIDGVKIVLIRLDGAVHALAGLFQPLRQGSFDNAFAHLGHDDIGCHENALLRVRAGTGPSSTEVMRSQLA